MARTILAALVLLLGGCRGAAETSATPAPHTYGALNPGQIGPFVFPPSWSQASWYIDPQNTSSCASDSNLTCGLSGCGTSNDGPCLTYQSVANRWGTYSPRLRQTTAVNWLSGQTSTYGADPFIFDPYVENGAIVTVNGTLSAETSGTLNAVTSKNRATPQLLEVTFSTVAVQGWLIHNTTHPSYAWTYTNVTGNQFLMTQPLLAAAAPVSLGMGATYTEVDTWASGDAWAGFVPPVVNVAEIRPHIESGSYPVTVYRLLVGSGGTAPVRINESVGFIESHISSNSPIVWEVYNTPNGAQQEVGGVQFNTYAETWFQGGSPGQGLYGVSSAYAQSPLPYVYGGALNALGSSTSGCCAVNGLTVDYDTLMVSGATPGVTINTLSIGYVYLTQVPLVTWMNAYTSPRGTAPMAWGPGNFNINSSGRLFYNGTTTFTSIFLNNTGSIPVTLNGATTGCNVGVGSSATWNCGVSITPSAVDTAIGSGGFGGVVVNPGGASINKNGP